MANNLPGEASSIYSDTVNFHDTARVLIVTEDILPISALKIE